MCAVGFEAHATDSLPAKRGTERKKLGSLTYSYGGMKILAFILDHFFASGG